MHCFPWSTFYGYLTNVNHTFLYLHSYILDNQIYIASEYQETACRSAKVLGIPVLDIDKGITEIIAFNKSTCAIQLRQIIDDVYQKYIEAFEKWKYDPDRINRY